MRLQFGDLKSKSSRSGGPSTNSSATPSSTSPATPTTPTLGHRPLRQSHSAWPRPSPRRPHPRPRLAPHNLALLATTSPTTQPNTTPYTHPQPSCLTQGYSCRGQNAYKLAQDPSFCSWRHGHERVQVNPSVLISGHGPHEMHGWSAGSPTYRRFIWVVLSWALAAGPDLEGFVSGLRRPVRG
jgi:hypothetical protein